jgi:hypothetical protein
MAPKPARRYNRLCQRCSRRCKQLAHVTVISCPKFDEKPVQLLVPLKFPPGRPKKLRTFG